MIVLSDADKKNIVNMSDEDTKYCSYPNVGFSVGEIEEFMEIK